METVRTWFLAALGVYAGLTGATVLLIAAWMCYRLARVTVANIHADEASEASNEPPPEHLTADQLPPETTVELSDGTVMTVAEWRAQFTERQWETFEALAAEYSALHMQLD